MSSEANEDRRYPRPLVDVRRATQHALAALGWKWTSSTDGGFDAVWTSRVFKFKDDVVVRLHSANGTLVRVRSASRLRFLDTGQNARHVHDFFEELERQLTRAR